MIQLACENLHDDFDVINEPVTESLKKNKKRTVPVHKVYTPPMWNTPKQGKAIKFSILPTK